MLTQVEEEEEHFIHGDYEKLQTVLLTPENPTPNTTFYYSDDANVDTSRDKTKLTSFAGTISNTEQSLNNTNEIPFHYDEWQINDPSSCKMRSPKQHEFLQLLLDKPHYHSYICWIDKNRGLFKLLQPNRVAALWKEVKGRQTRGKMNYDKFARGIRYYYKTGLMIKTNKKHTFCFKLTEINTST